jgi:30S ribosomal protein S31
MGKGDKKSRRGKIILGTYGVKRRRKKSGIPEIKPLIDTASKETKDKKHVREKADMAEVNESAEVKDAKAAKDKVALKAPKTSGEKKESGDAAGESKPKKEKKS